MPQPSVVDAHYTPPWLAKRVVKDIRLPLESPVIADLAAGNGALLQEAEALFGRSATYLAVDADVSAVDSLRRHHPLWVAHLADVFSGDFHEVKIKQLPKVDLLLLNPPFSYRGAGGVRVQTDEISGRFSPAMAFLIHSVRLMRDTGQCLAILPENSLESERDAAAVEYLSEAWGMRVLDQLPFRSFPRIHARTAVVEIGCGAATAATRPAASSSAPLPGGPELLLVRGTLPVHRVDLSATGATEFLHTTGLTCGLAAPTRLQLADRAGRTVDGPFLAIPRVGALTLDKIGIYAGEGRVTLSDCVYALKPSLGTPAALRDLLVETYDRLAARYQGSCARYLTVARLTDLLTSLGFRVHIQEGRRGAKSH